MSRHHAVETPGDACAFAQHVEFALAPEGVRTSGLREDFLRCRGREKFGDRFGDVARVGVEIEFLTEP